MSFKSLLVRAGKSSSVLILRAVLTIWFTLADGFEFIDVAVSAALLSAMSDEERPEALMFDTTL